MPRPGRKPVVWTPEERAEVVTRMAEIRQRDPLVGDRELIRRAMEALPPERRPTGVMTLVRVRRLVAEAGAIGLTASPRAAVHVLLDRVVPNLHLLIDHLLPPASATDEVTRLRAEVGALRDAVGGLTRQLVGLGQRLEHAGLGLPPEPPVPRRRFASTPPVELARRPLVVIHGLDAEAFRSVVEKTRGLARLMRVEDPARLGPLDFDWLILAHSTPLAKVWQVRAAIGEGKIVRMEARGVGRLVAKIRELIEGAGGDRSRKGAGGDRSQQGPGRPSPAEAI